MANAKRNVLHIGCVLGASLILFIAGGMLAQQHRATHFPAEAVASRVEPDGTLHLEITIQLPVGMSGHQAGDMYQVTPQSPRRRIAVMGDLDEIMKKQGQQ